MELIKKRNSVLSSILALTMMVSCSTDSPADASTEPQRQQDASVPVDADFAWEEGSTIPSGVPGAPDIRVTKVVKNGAGPVCALGKTAKVKYRAMKADGTVVDPGLTPLDIVVGQTRVIKAWHTIISHMRVGDSFTVQIPEAVVASEGARYANQGDWIFDMEVLGVH